MILSFIVFRGTYLVQKLLCQRSRNFFTLFFFIPTSSAIRGMRVKCLMCLPFLVSFFHSSSRLVSENDNNWFLRVLNHKLLWKTDRLSNPKWFSQICESSQCQWKDWTSRGRPKNRRHSERFALDDAQNISGHLPLDPLVQVSLAPRVPTALPFGNSRLRVMCYRSEMYNCLVDFLSRFF